ncbi:hypothetical protein P8452_02552 [Trifolium repens]|nr:hypothetical protein P8452_02552 [Trifolium repens]
METEEKKNIVPNTPSDDGVDKDQLNLKAAEDSLKSLAHSVPSVNVVPDAPSSLAQDQPQADVQDDIEHVIADDVIEKDTTVVADSPVQQEKDVSDDVNTDNAMIVDEDVTIVKTVGDPNKRSGKTGVSSRLRERKHVADITMLSKKVTSSGKVASSSMNRKTMIISMEAAVRALDEQKKELEKVITALQQEEAEEEGIVADDAGVDAGNAAAGDGVDAADGDAAMNEDVEAGGDTEELEMTDSSNSF